MKKIILAVGSFLVLSSFTGCISFFEELFINANGSGHFKRTLDMSEMAELKESLKSMGDKEKKEEEAPQSPDEMGQAMVEEVETLKKIDGISNVTSTKDTVKMIYTVEFDFQDDAALNKALGGTSSNEAAKSAFSIGKSSITRNNYNSFSDLAKADDDKEVAEAMEAIMSDMKYTLSITVPGNVKRVSNSRATISSDKKQITIATNMQELADKTTSLEVKVDYK